MLALTGCILLATLSVAPLEARYPQAVEVYACGFEQPSDANFDGWPDQWTRRKGPGYPHYLPIKLTPDKSPEGEQCLRMSLDGGAALVQSPAIEIEPTSSYVLEASIRTELLARDEAVVAIAFLDKDRRPLETVRLAGVRDPQWRKVRLGPVATKFATARYAAIELSVAPTDGEDLKGAALFDDVWLARLPKMSVRTNRPHNLFLPDDFIKATCEISGFDAQQQRVVFDLFDVQQQRVGQHVEVLKAGPNQPKRHEIPWQPPQIGPGFYRLRVAMHSEERLILEREMSLAIIEPRPVPPGGEFGWSLSQGAGPLPLIELAELLGRMGINWVKYPLWLSEEDLARNHELVRFVERMSSQQIELVGLLSQPPASLRAKFGRKDVLSAADIFSAEPDVWYPALEGVLTQLSTKVRWWQLGVDEDASFVGYPQLAGKIVQVKRQMDRLGQNTRLGFGWSWTDEDPQARQPAWRFINMSVDPPLAAGELGTYLSRASKGATERWVTIEPLDANEYSTTTRAADLVQRVIAAKKHGAAKIFASQPFSTRRGLLNDDGTPGELLGPWLMTSAALSGARHLGSLRLPGGCSNEIFARDQGEAVMFVWSQSPQRVKLELGDGLQHIDLWGRPLGPIGGKNPSEIQVGALPSLVTGLSEPVVRAALTFAFEQDSFPSVLGEAHTSGVRLKNWLSRGASGKLRLVTPEGWQVRPREFDFKLAAGEEFRAPFELRFPYDANNGPQEVHVEVQMSADKRYEFSVHRPMQIGLGDLVLEASTELTDNGELLVHQRLENRTDEEVNFRCDLYAANRRRLRTQVLQLSRGTDVQTYRLPGGREMIGQTLWIRAEEVGGQRALSHRFKAEE